MPTPAQIQTALAAAQANRLTYAEKADLLDLAIDNAIVGNSGEVAIPWSATGADGVSISRMTITEATDLARRYRMMDSGGVVSQFMEFRDGAGYGG